MEANLLVTYDPNHPGKAEREASALLDDFGAFKIIDSTIPGILLIHADDSKRAVAKMKKLPQDSFEYTFKWVPIEKWVPTEMEEIAPVLKDFDKRIGKEESWRLLLFKRQYDGHDSMQLVKLLTENISSEKVNLKSPDKLVVVEIVGKNTGISLLDNSEYLDTKKMR